jgi:hypothetical protein
MDEITRKTLVRRLAVRLLDDDEGASREVWTYLWQLLSEAGHQDIIDQVEVEGSRFYLSETAQLLPEDRIR